MKVGDLVKFRCPVATQINKVFLITEIKDNSWIGLDDNPIGSRLYHHIRDIIVVNKA